LAQDHFDELGMVIAECFYKHGIDSTVRVLEVDDLEDKLRDCERLQTETGASEAVPQTNRQTTLRSFQRNALRQCIRKDTASATALRLENQPLSFPRVAEAATLGWRA